MLMASGLNHGIRKSLPHFFGICLGFPLMVALVGFGMGALFVRIPNLYTFIKVAGIVYLLFLAWKIANSGNARASQKTRAPFSFMQAVAFQWLNPKAWAIAIGALATFTKQSHFTLSVLTVVGVYFCMGFLCMGLWLKLGQSLKSVLAVGNRTHYFNISMALLLVVSIIPMALSNIEEI